MSSPSDAMATRSSPAALVEQLLRRLLRLSLFAKLLLANSAIVALGATAGTYVTTRHVQASPHGTQYEMMALFAAIGLALSLGVNALVLRTALLPLARLERTARRVLAGDLDARATLGRLGDPDTDQLARTFNAMLDSLRTRQRQIETYAARLQELSDRVLLAQEEERHRLAGELHDDLGQELSSLLLQLRLFRDAAAKPGADPAALAQQAAGLAEQAREALDGVRRLALELRPRALEDLGLAAALRAYAEEWSARTRVALSFHAALPPGHALSSAAEIALYRLVQEALANVARHAAASRVGVTLEEHEDAAVVEVHDDGCGFALDRVTSPARGAARNGAAALAPAQSSHQEQPQADPATATQSAGAAAASSPALFTSGLPGARTSGAPGNPGAGLGLFTMQERIALAGGTLTIESAPGQGTTVRATLPLARATSVPHAALSDYPVAVSGVR